MDFRSLNNLVGPGAIPHFLSSFSEDPAKKAMPYLEGIPGAISPYYEPYMKAGAGALPVLQGEYGDLISNPGGFLNKMGQGFQQSPGFKFALDQALQGSGHAAAAGGMAGSPEHQFQNMQIGTQLGNQDYYNYIKNALGIYGTGLEGFGGIARMGQQAGSSMADQIAQALASQAQLRYAGTANQNQSNNAMFGNIMQGLGSLAAFL